MGTVLKIAIQKEGRLQEESLKLLRDCGISISNGGNKLKSTAVNFPLEVLCLRNTDIPQYINDGVVDAGITGLNVLAEQQKDANHFLPLGFARCRLSLAIPRQVEYPGVSFFQGKKLATSYPVSLKKFLCANKIEAEIHAISGSVEIAPGIGLADGICDLVSSGSTLLANGLKEVEIIQQSEAVLADNPEMPGGKRHILDKLAFRIRAVLNARKNKYVLLNAPDECLPAISRILPGMKSPTVMPLARKGWSSLHSVISEDDFWQLIDDLRLAGAEGILIIPIEKMIA